MSSLLPEYPVDREEQKTLADAADAPATTPTTEPEVPSELTFAQEVRAERLGILWRVTLFIAFMSWWVLFVVTGGQDISFLAMFAPTLTVALGCIATGQFLRRDQFPYGVWSFAVGTTLGVGVAMTYAGTFGQEYAPFIFPLLVFVIGLLLPVRDTLVLLAVVWGIALGLPSLAEGKLTFGNHAGFAMALTTLAAALSTQVSGELYAIAEWALENYRKERSTTFALFESREALQKSLLRQRSLNQAVHEANRELEVARKAEEEAKHFRGQFLANMSHELRTPLNAIIGFSQTMLDFPAMYDSVELPDQYQKDMTQILSSGKHLLSIINDILDLSKVDAGKLDLELQPVDIGPVMKGVLSTAVGLVGEKANRVRLLQEAPDPLPMCVGDPLRVRQVLLNLFSNSAKFTDSGTITLIVTVEGEEVIFAVQDTGIGIADADKASIFEEFRQGTAGRKKGRQGAGLGLAISQQLLRLMNGRLWFDSTLGKGSTFYIALPLHVPGDTEPVEAVDPTASQLRRPVTQTLRSDLLPERPRKTPAQTNGTQSAVKPAAAAEPAVTTEPVSDSATTSAEPTTPTSTEQTPTAKTS